ncbi:C40 family peptidase [Roseovarius sp. LXJ103]|uniref:C40 family peptidase n=1 Tax=Roseovarius carneus TaxID=2853164 RepID=UPI000D614F4D|nr:NlpC/P60 family protein [Roseovarius carneus]MBZ8117718.1 C40 family peptidase [Roseovarius carneus]PWE36509.1 NLP/P60 hydrolase [Pelagicola sp. LXJ1103]
MTDRRFLAANARVAESGLRGRVDAPAYTDGTAERIALPHADLCRAPGGARDKQMLFGQGFRVLERHEGWAFGIDMADGYVGYLPEAALGDTPRPTHRIGQRGAHLYSAPNFKSPERGLLSFLSCVAVSDETHGFHRTAQGYIAAQHLVPLAQHVPDIAATATLFLGTPYLWGGNTGTGIDCSGLIQMALWAAGRTCPRDSDLQEAQLGVALPDDAPLERGDLIFWSGHVGMMLDPETLIHANAHHMRVETEPLAEATARIGAREFGAITVRKRLEPAP